MESYKKWLEEHYGKLINVKPFNDSDLKDNKTEKCKLAPATVAKLLILLTKKG